MTTDGSGYFRVGKLQPGTYTVTVTEQGFAPYKAEQVIVQVGSVTDLSPRLAIGGSTETVDVSAEAPQINTTSADFAPTLNQDSNFQPAYQRRALVKFCHSYARSCERCQRFWSLELPWNEHLAQ